MLKPKHPVEVVIFHHVHPMTNSADAVLLRRRLLLTVVIATADVTARPSRATDPGT